MSECLIFRTVPNHFVSSRTFSSEPTPYNKEIKSITCAKITKYGNEYYCIVPLYDYVTYKRKITKNPTFNFNTPPAPIERNISANLFDYQTVECNRLLDCLEKDRVAVCALSTGRGKTRIALEIAKILKLDTIVLTNRTNIAKAWKDSHEQMKSDSSIDIVTIQTLHKITKKYAFAIFDEMPELFTSTHTHTIMEKIHRPRYILGLSATPKRQDYLNGAIELFFGPLPETSISLRYASLDIFLVDTKLSFTTGTKRTYNGFINYSDYKKNTAKNETRNTGILEVVNHLLKRNRTILIVCSLVEHCVELKSAISQICSNVNAYTGSSITFDPSSKVLIATIQKIQSGFNWIEIDTLIITQSVKSHESITQVIGRVTRVPTVKAEIYDIYDSDYIGKRHLKNRIEIYKQTNAAIHRRLLSAYTETQVR